MNANPTSATFRDVVPIEAKNEEIGLLLGLLTAGTQNMRRELGELGEEALIWQPFPNCHSIGALLIHVADPEAAVEVRDADHFLHPFDCHHSDKYQKSLFL